MDLFHSSPDIKISTELYFFSFWNNWTGTVTTWLPNMAKDYTSGFDGITWPDYLIIAFYFIFVLAAGLYVSSLTPLNTKLLRFYMERNLCRSNVIWWYYISRSFDLWSIHVQLFQTLNHFRLWIDLEALDRLHSTFII